MATVKITDISGLTVPYDIYVCDKDGNDCVFVSTITRARINKGDSQ